MNNPYDIYNDNRAYYGYEKCKKDVIELIKGIMDKSNKRTIEVLNELIKGIE